MDDAGGVYGTNFHEYIKFTSIIRGCITDLCDKTATIQTMSKRRQRVAGGGSIPDAPLIEQYQAFVFAIMRLFQYSREMIPEPLTIRINAWISSVSIPGAGNIMTPAEFQSINEGIRLSEALQDIMYEKGLKDTIAPTEFDFEKYLSISDTYDSSSAVDFDPLQEGFDILGYSSRSEYAYLYTQFINKTFELMSHNQFDDARVFFYAALPAFAPVFDRPFLLNCISIKKDHSSKLKGGKGIHNTIYQLQMAEFSALMNRANILQQPDIIDCRLPEYLPASEPGGMKK